MRITCPVCATVFDLGPDAYGRKVQCTCGQKFFVEAPAEKTPESTATATPAETPSQSDGLPQPTAQQPVSAETKPEIEAATPSAPMAEAEPTSAVQTEDARPNPLGSKRSFRTKRASTTTAATTPPKKKRKGMLVLAALLLAAATGGYLYQQKNKLPSAKQSAATETTDLKDTSGSAPEPKIQVSDKAVNSQYLSTAKDLSSVSPTNVSAADWKRTHASPSTFKYEAWPKPYAGGPGFSWWEPKETDCANRWIVYLGPLGVQAQSLNAVFQKHIGFDQAYPDEMKDADGRLVANALLVTKVFPGSPADGHLQEGDLILEMENEPLLDSMLVDPTNDYRTKSARNLGLHAGWLIDHAEGRGKIDLKILRDALTKTYSQRAEVTTTKQSPIIDVSTDLSNAQFLKLHGTTDGGNTDYSSFNWLTPTLTGPGKPDLDLSKENWLTGTCGWRSIQRGLDVSKKTVTIDGKEIKSVIGTHGESEIVFRIPEGYTQFSAQLQKISRRDIVGTIYTANEKFQDRAKRTYRELFRQQVKLGGDFHAGPSLRGSTRDASFNIALKDATEVTLEVNGDPSHHSGWANWITPTLRGVGKPPIELTSTDWKSATTGWGKIRRGTDMDGKPVIIDGQPIMNVIGAHANSQITYDVPKGYTHLVSKFQLGHRNGKIIPGIRLRSGPDMVLDVDVTNTDRIRISCEQAPIEIHNLRLEGPAGTVTGFSVIAEDRTKLHQDGPLAFKANTKNAAAYVIQIPPGNWRLTGDVRIGNKPAEIAIESLPKLPLPTYLAAHQQHISFPINKIGSFKEGFPGDHCEKSQTITDLTAAWLLAQQEDNGSWPRRAGYCSPAMDTSLCVLALLAVDNPQYDSAIRRGIEYLMYECPYSDWACPNGLALTAMSEYYLRTNADWVVSGIEQQAERCSKFVYGDFTCGHGANPGYGDGGVNYGGAHLALGFAIAAKTPARFRKELLDGLMWRVQSLAPGGYVPYTRHNRSTFSDKPSTSYAAGARTGVYLTAAQLYGGPKHFIEHATRHLGDRTLGGGDQGHASKIFSFMGSTIGLAATDRQLLHEHAKRYGWALTLTRRYDGGFVWNSELLEYMGAESVMNILYRSSTYLLLLNAHKQNLGITGKREFRSKTAVTHPKLTDSDRRIWHYYRSNWQAVRANLGDSSPAALTAACKELDALQYSAGEDMISRLFAIVEAQGQVVTDAIQALSRPKSEKDALSELILGVDFRIDVQMEKDDPKKGKIQLTIQYPMAGKLLGAAEPQVSEGRVDVRFPFSGSITLTDPSATLIPSPTILTTPDATKADWKKGAANKTITIDLSSETPPQLDAAITYKIMGRTVAYGRRISIPHKRTNNRIIRIPGTISRDHLRHSVSITLPDGTPLECVNVSYEGKSDIQFPVSYNGISSFSDSRPAFPLLTGCTGTFGYQSDISRVVPAAATDAIITAAPIIKIVALSSEATPLSDKTALSDWNLETTNKIQLPATGKTTIACKFSQPENLNKFLFAAKGRYACNVTALVGTEWIRIYGADPKNGLQPLRACKTSEVRIEIIGKPKAKIDLQELHFYRSTTKRLSL